MRTQVCETRAVKCPLCNKGKLLNASKSITPSSVRTHPPPFYDMAEYFVKCPKCKSQIGISIINEKK